MAPCRAGLGSGCAAAAPVYAQRRAGCLHGADWTVKHGKPPGATGDGGAPPPAPRQLRLKTDRPPRRRRRRRQLAAILAVGQRLAIAGAPRPRPRLRALAGAVEELDRVGDDADRLAALLLGGLPLAPLQPAVDGHAAALAHVAAHALRRRAVDAHVEEVRPLGVLAIGLAAAGVARDSQATHSSSRRAARAARGHASDARPERRG